MNLSTNEWNKVQINFSEDRTASGEIIRQSTLLNIRTNTVREALQLYKELKAKIEGKEEKPKRKIEEVKESKVPECPRCGSLMILRRNSKKGNWFYGCTAFPLCDGTRQQKVKKEVEDLIIIESK